jgi:hypothetical protein
LSSRSKPLERSTWICAGRPAESTSTRRTTVPYSRRRWDSFGYTGGAARTYSTDSTIGGVAVDAGTSLIGVAVIVVVAISVSITTGSGVGSEYVTFIGGGE